MKIELSFPYSCFLMKGGRRMQILMTAQNTFHPEMTDPILNNKRGECFDFQIKLIINK